MSPHATPDTPLADHGPDLGFDSLPPYSPARETGHPNAAAWRYYDGLITDQAATMVAEMRGIPIADLMRTVRLTPYNWATNYSRGKEEPGFQLVLDIIRTLQDEFDRGWGALSSVWSGLHEYLDPYGRRLGGNEAVFKIHFKDQLRTLAEEKKQKGHVHPVFADQLFPTVSLSLVYRMLADVSGEDEDGEE
ncbi:hypothetical protein Q8F55_002691 [Vanrija albida]|uniref:Uncharacterized protein n=1 Tax=Vanrija albida TaxID=181172 RepID=A0ABR3QAQ2_9TREE